MRAFLLLAVCAGATSVNIVLFIASSRQLLDAYAERVEVQKVAVHLHNWLSNCRRN